MSLRASLFQRFLIVNYVPKRNCSEGTEGIKYLGFTYYPRHKDHQDPPYEPSKLLFVRRIKSMKGRNPTERKTLEVLQISGEERCNGHINVLKNIPQINCLLWKVKHLVEIKPLVVRGELPKDGDYSGTFLRQTGELVVSPRLKVTPEQIEASEKCNRNKLHHNYLKEYLRLKWDACYNSYE